MLLARFMFEFFGIIEYIYICGDNGVYINIGIKENFCAAHATFKPILMTAT